MDSALIILNQVLIMYLLMGVGFASYKLKIVSDTTNGDLSQFMLNFAIPAVILNVFQKDFKPELAQNMAIAVALSFACHIIAIWTAKIFIKKKGNENNKIERFSVIYSNCAFMAIPLIDAIFRETGVLFAISNIAVFNVLLFTHGTALFSKSVNIRQAIKSLASPSIICIIIGVIMFIFQIKFPFILGEPIKYLAALNTPLGMIIAGIFVAQSNVKTAFTNKRIYFISFLRLLAVPFACLVFLSFFPADPTVKLVLLLSMTCPTATTALMLAHKYGHNPQYGSQIITITTLFCIFAIPFILFLGTLANQWFHT